MKAAHGERMIELRIRFFTDKIVKTAGEIKPKHAWDRGVVIMTANRSHGISPKPPKGAVFNSLMELPRVMEKVLIDHGIKFHLGNRSNKYLA